MKRNQILHCLLVFSILFLTEKSYAQNPIIIGGTVVPDAIYQNQSYITISGLHFNNVDSTGNNNGGICLELDNCQNVLITNCILGPSYGVGIQLNNCTNVKITNCRFIHNQGGVYALNSEHIQVYNNQFSNIKGPAWSHRKQFVQFNQVSGSGNEIGFNSGENIFGPNSNVGDMVNLWASSGVPDSPIMVVGNQFRGTSPSFSGGGLLAGDGGGAYETIQDNILVNPGGYGVGAASGQYINLLGNKIYAATDSLNTNGIYIWNEYVDSPCGNILVDSNLVNYYDRSNSNAYSVEYDDHQNCQSVSLGNNNMFPDPSITSAILPDRLLYPILMAHYQFNGTWNDNSGNLLNATPENGTAYAGQGEDRMCAYFNSNGSGTTNYLSLPNSPWFEPGAERITVSLWIKPSTVQGEQGLVQSQDGDGYNTGWRMLLEDNTFNAHIATDQGPMDIYCGGIVAGAWTHLVMTWNGSYLKGYVNGVLQDSAAISGNILTNGSNSPSIIGYCGGTGYFSGMMDEVKIYNGNLLDAEVLQDYNANYPAVTSPLPEIRAYYQLDGNFLDVSGNNLTATNNNGVSFVCDGEGYAANFNGTGSYLSSPQSFLLDPFSANYTVSCWIKPFTVSGIQGIAQSQNGNGYTSGWGILLLNSTFNANVITNEGTTSVYCAGIQPNVWNYVAVTYNGTSLTAYVNNNPPVSVASGGYIPYNTSSPMYIGMCNGSNYYFNGNMNVFQFYDGALTSAAIQQIYNTQYPLVNAPPNCPLTIQSPLSTSAAPQELPANAIADSDQLSISPNPASSIVTIRYLGQHLSGNGLLQVELYDGQGRFIKAGSGDPSGVSLPVGNLSAGMYYVRIITADKVVTRKVIISRL